MRRLAGGAGRRGGPEIRLNPSGPRPGKESGMESSQACADCASLSAVERREAQPLSPKGARVPGQASQTCLVRRAERALARPVRGLASPWRLPALHAPPYPPRKRERVERGGKQKGKRRTRAAKQRTGPAERWLSSFLVRGRRAPAVLALDMRQQPSRPLNTPSFRKKQTARRHRYGIAC